MAFLVLGGKCNKSPTRLFVVLPTVPNTNRGASNFRLY
jgi:hypothetical protein